MDFSSFADENFSVKGWINAALGPSGKSPEESHEAHLQLLIMKLQLSSLDLSNALEEVSISALSGIPRAMVTIEKLRKEAASLRERLTEFDAHLATIESNTDSSIRLLSDVDKVKTRMESCCKALEQVDRLTKLSSDIEQVFAINDYQKITEKIESMQYSISLLKGVEEYKDSVAQVARLQNRLEGMLKPMTLQALQTRNAKQALDYQKVFQRIQKGDTFTQLYIACRVMELEGHWDALAKPNPTAPSPAPPQPTPTSPTSSSSTSTEELSTNTTSRFGEWLPMFFERVLELLQTEQRFASQLFSREQHVLFDLVMSLLNKLSKSFTAQVDAVASSGPRGLTHVIHLYQITSQFAHALGHHCGLGDGAESLQMRRTLQRRLLSGFVNAQRQYGALEYKLVSREVAHLRVELKSGEYMPLIRALEINVPKVFLVAETSLRRCIEFTRGEQLEALVSRVLTPLLLQYVEHLCAVVAHLRVQAHLDSAAAFNPADGSVAAATTSASLAAGGSSVVSAAAAAPYDWSLFRGALQMLQVAQMFASRFDAFDRQLKKALLEVRGTIFAALPPELASDPAAVTKSSLEKLIRLLDVLDDSPDALLQLHQFLHGPAAEPARKVLVSISTEVGTLRSAATALVYDSVFFYIKDTLATFPLLPAWTARVGDDAVSQQLASEPSALSPLSYIFRVATHLWTLNEQQLESAGDVGSSAEPPSTASADPAAEIGTHLVNNVARGTVTLFVQRILDLPQLSELGAQQLSHDINYFLDFLTAMNIAPDPALRRMQQLLSIPLGDFPDMAKNLSAQDELGANLTNTLLAMRTAGAATTTRSQYM